MTKKILITKKPLRPEPIRLWEAEEAQTPVVKQPTKRLTLDIPADLHLRMKMECLRRGVSMTDDVTAMLEERFPGGAIGQQLVD